MSMTLKGLVAGAAGTAAINATTYLDMTVRGRPSSDVPAKTAAAIADAAHVDLGTGDRARSRRTGLGALFGYANGVGLGIVYSMVRSRTDRVPRGVAAVALGAAAMAASDVTSTVTGATNPSTWSRASWLADVVPHLVYGVVTVSAFERFARR